MLQNQLSHIVGIFSVDSEGQFVESQASLRNLRLYFPSTGGYELEW